MSFQTVNIGAAPDDGTGDPLRTAFDKLNQNFLIVRERLTANRTYYVRVDGSDSNTGLADTSGGAFLTVQKAIDTAAELDQVGLYTITIRIADGTYQYSSSIKPRDPVGSFSNSVLIIGNTGSPQNVVLQNTSAFGNCLNVVNSRSYSISGVQLDISVGQGTGIYCGIKSYVTLATTQWKLGGSNNFGTYVEQESVLIINSGSLTGSGTGHYFLYTDNGIIYKNAAFSSNSATIAFTYIFYAINLGRINDTSGFTNAENLSGGKAYFDSGSLGSFWPSFRSLPGTTYGIYTNASIWTNDLGPLHPLDQREKLTADRTYYVRTDGSDTNRGIVNTSAGAFLTIQKAIDVVASLDLSIYRVTINVGAGTYTEDVETKQLVGGPGPNVFNNNKVMNVNVVGDETTPANVIIKQVSSTLAAPLRIHHAGYCFTGFTLQPLNFANSVNVYEKAICRLGVLVFDSSQAWITNFISGIVAYDNALIYNADKTWTFKGTEFYVGLSISDASVISYGGLAYPDTPAFSYANIFVNRNGYLEFSGSISGTATGVRARVYFGGIVELYGSGLGYFPGDVGEKISSGGVYDGIDQRRIQVKTSSYQLDQYDHQGTFSNEGASAIVPFLLDNALAGVGQECSFIVQDSDGIRVTAKAGDTIRVASNVSMAGGKIESTTIGDAITLKSINSTEWIATNIVGTWTPT